MAVPSLNELMAVTHVDTSTAVGADVQGLAALGRRYGMLVVVDGVCSVAGEELRQEKWGVDLALTASQKAIGTPPGLALVVAGPRAKGLAAGYPFGRTITFTCCPRR